jgi:hypothetical protein
MTPLTVWFCTRSVFAPLTLTTGRRAVSRLSLFALLLLVSVASGSAATWSKLTNPAPSSIQIMVQMTDGTILVQSFNGQTWMKLTPDATGSYINGTWTVLASGPTARLYFPSQVLPDGRFWLAGGEYSGPGLLANWSSTGEIYDPIANTWTSIAPYPNQPGCPFLPYVSGNLTIGSPQIKGIYPYASGLQVGWLVSGAGIPAGASIVSIDSATQITISANATATRTASTVNFNHSYQLVACLGDDPSILLAGGSLLVGDLINSNTYTYNPATDSWVKSATKVYADSSDEEGWAKVGDGTVLNYDLFKSVATGGSYAEKYNPATGIWSSISPSDGSAVGTIPQLSGNSVGFELGPVLRLQDGRMLVIGATQHTALFDPSTSPLPTWAAGPDIIGTLNGNPSPFGADDAPGAILPNGHVIFAADAAPSGFTSSGNITSGSKIITNIPSTAILHAGWSVRGTGIPGGSFITSVDSSSQVHIDNAATATIVGDAISWGGTFSPPTQLFDFNPTTNSISPLSPAIPDTNLNFMAAYPTRMLMLPTGQLLFSDDSPQMWVFTPDGPPNPALRPVINAVAYNGGGIFTLTGKQLNGQSAGAAYGDDDQMNTNYPIIRMVNAAGKVFYARTTNWSAVGVDGGTTPETVNFTLNPGITPGNYVLIDSGAGISSFPLFINITAAEVAGQ